MLTSNARSNGGLVNLLGGIVVCLRSASLQNAEADEARCHIILRMGLLSRVNFAACKDLLRFESRTVVTRLRRDTPANVGCKLVYVVSELNFMNRLVI